MNEMNKTNETAGDITGNMRITGTGEIFITSKLDGHELIFCVKADDDAFSINVVECTVPQLQGHLLEVLRFGCTVPNVDDATKMLCSLVAPLNLCPETMESIPHAIECAWRSPSEVKAKVDEMVRMHELSA